MSSFFLIEVGDAFVEHKNFRVPARGRGRWPDSCFPGNSARNELVRLRSMTDMFDREPELAIKGDVL
jgi:hypothetical protein